MITIEFLRSFKLGEYSIFDLSTSFIGIYLLSPLLSKLFTFIKLDIPKLSWIYLTLPLSILTHILIRQDTLMTKYFLDPTGHYILKLLIITLLILGIRGISIIK